MGELLARVDEAIAHGKAALAVALLRQVLEEKPTSSTAAVVSRRVAQLGSAAGLRPVRAMFLRSFTVEPIFPLLRAGALLHGLDIELKAGAFNSYAQEALDAKSQLYAFDPDIVFLAVQSRDLVPELWRGPLAAEQGRLVDQAAASLRSWIGHIRSGSRASVVVWNFESPAQAAAGILDAQRSEGQAAAFALLNQELRTIAKDAGAYVLDYEGLVARHGRMRWHDERKWLMARMPIAADCLPLLAEECLRLILPITGRVRKALVVDLDNTLWGGVVGEDGPEGVRIGPEYPGAAFVELQRTMRALADRGVLLAIASKNNPADALEVLERHPAMLLRPTDFAALRIGWNDKEQSLREIARELDIGLDSMVFLDDNPVERERIRTELPEVLVLDLPADPMGYAAALARTPVFDRLALSAEDSRRGRLYAEERQRGQLEKSTGTLEDFYRSLKMEMAIARLGPATRARVAQLTQKTNQFNATTRRYSEEEIDLLGSSSEARVFSYGVRDRFGDNGLVGVAILRTGGPTWEIDTLLMSCRVIGRTVESAMMAHLIRDARDGGAKRLRGWYLATPKNGPAREVYPAHGFHMIEEREQDRLWEIDLFAAATPWPQWIRLQQGEAWTGKAL